MYKDHEPALSCVPSIFYSQSLLFNIQVLCLIADKKGVISPSKITQTKPVSSATQSPVNNQSPEQTPVSVKAWQIGQILKASVLEQLSNTTLLLKIGNTQFTAKTNLSIPPGAELQLKVIKQGEQPLLKIISLPSSKTETSLAALRQAIPKQAPLANLFPVLKLMDQHLPQVIQQAVQSLQAGISSRMDLLNPEGIKKALNESGIFLESNLSDQKLDKTIQGDLKGKLLRLTDLLRNENLTQNQSAAKNNLLSQLADNKAITDLQRHVESTLARIQLNQLNSLPNTDPHSQVFLLELPVKDKENIDVFSLKINEEDQQKTHQESSKRWSIQLSFNLDGLGNIHTKLLLGSERIQASLWAEKETTFDLIKTNLHQLRERLTDVEFIDPDVKCFKGKPETELSPLANYNELINVEI